MGQVMAGNIEIRNLSKIYETESGDEIIALEDVDLHIAENEFVTLVGQSGCGKSTLLKLIGALGSPTNGVLMRNGRIVTGPSNDVGFVFQDPVLLPWRTALDNILLPVEILGLNRAQYEHEARRLLDLVGLAGFENKKSYELSGGMQQRVAICRALIHAPSILLMDEPFGALDALTREDLMLELLRIWEAQPKTVVFVTHSIVEAVLLADRVVVMSPRPGRIARIVPIELPRPRTIEMEFDPFFRHCASMIRDLIGRRDG